MFWYSSCPPFALMTARTTAGMDSKGLCKNMVTWIQIWVKQLYYLSFRELHCFSLRNYLDSILCLYSNYKYPEVIWGKAKILGTFAGYFSHNKCTYASKNANKSKFHLPIVSDIKHFSSSFNLKTALKFSTNYSGVKRTISAFKMQGTITWEKMEILY